jgi:ectoine hydroxylase-related dioxygenase (phytanoyl-CoA dioxygenase family)
VNREPLNPITDEHIAQFERDGVLCLRRMFDEDWIAKMNRAVNRIMDAQHPLARPREVTKALGGKSGRYHINSFVWHWDEDFRDWVMNSPMPLIAARMLHANEVRVFYDQVFVKEPQTAEMTDWHQDLPFWPMRGSDILSIWVALTPVNQENSAVEYIAGSHKWGKFYAAVTPDKDAKFKSELELCPNYSKEKGNPKYRFLSFDLQPGDCVLHHPLTVHGAEGNFSPSRRRVGISTRYFGRDCQWDPRPATMKITGDPVLQPGARPEDDNVFPVAWRV